MSGDDLPIKVYEGEPSDVAFLISLLASTGIEVVRSGPFFAAGRFTSGGAMNRPRVSW